ncbi:MAG: hypothetical protein V4671_02905, partial [Armatimonadota bacterium]
QYKTLANDPKTPFRPEFGDYTVKRTPPDFGDEKLYGGDDDEAAGNAPVPVFPRRPVPVLAGGAARRFEESDEPPRNP